MKRKWSSVTVGTVAFALIAAACSTGSGAEDVSSSPSEVFTIGMPNGPQTDNSNPFLNTSSALSLGYAYAIYEPLAQVNSIRPAEDPVPWLATDWSWSEDFTAITLTVRDGVLWSDGEPLTAENDALNTNALPYGDITVEGSTVTVGFTSSTGTTVPSTSCG